MVHLMPFEYRHEKYLNIFNEVCVMLALYAYMFFRQSFEPNYTIGKVFKGIYMLNFGVNICKLLYF
jgi:hypothetical protein